MRIEQNTSARFISSARPHCDCYGLAVFADLSVCRECEGRNVFPECNCCGVQFESFEEAMAEMSWSADEGVFHCHRCNDDGEQEAAQ